MIEAVGDEPGLIGNLVIPYEGIGRGGAERAMEALLDRYWYEVQFCGTHSFADRAFNVHASRTRGHVLFFTNAEFAEELRRLNPDIAGSDGG